MAITDPPYVNDVEIKFTELLERADKLKPSRSLEPPLSASSFAGAAGLPPNPTYAKIHNSSVELAARRAFQSSVSMLLSSTFMLITTGSSSDDG